ncbi:hypothetical protein NDU88_001802 [Pleurodeles waltl]|uniref:Uncharacterized protein n=1 Tax=Pleurodeles waltl TaxID=8319 RepID=A0AAV7V8T0_PLEWA|nr:hypothetical protein NDU88_001802 [Pleurodeles waltl]
MSAGVCRWSLLRHCGRRVFNQEEGGPREPCDPVAPRHGCIVGEGQASISSSELPALCILGPRLHPLVLPAHWSTGAPKRGSRPSAPLDCRWGLLACALQFQLPEAGYCVWQALMVLSNAEAQTCAPQTPGLQMCA